MGSLLIANTVALLYSTTPVLFPVTARFKAIGARVIGSLIGLLYLCALGYALTEESLVAYGLERRERIFENDEYLILSV